MYNHPTNRGRKAFFSLFLTSCYYSRVIKHLNKWLKWLCKQIIKMTKRVPMLDSKMIKEKKLWVILNLKVFLVPEDNGKQNPDESYTNKM